MTGRASAVSHRRAVLWNPAANVCAYVDRDRVTVQVGGPGLARAWELRQEIRRTIQSHHPGTLGAALLPWEWEKRAHGYIEPVPRGYLDRVAAAKLKRTQQYGRPPS